MIQSFTMFLDIFFIIYLMDYSAIAIKCFNTGQEKITNSFLNLLVWILKIDFVRYRWLKNDAEGSDYSPLVELCRQQGRPVIDFNRKRCNDAVLSLVSREQSHGLDPPHPFGFIRCGIPRARATTNRSLADLHNFYVYQNQLHRLTNLESLRCFTYYVYLFLYRVIQLKE